MVLSSFFNGKKRALVEKTEVGYSVTLYLDEKLYQKRNCNDAQYAENIAEDFVLSGNNGPSLLNESV